MKILVTGSAGFIGFHLCRKLILKGYTVVGLDSINNYYDTKIKLERLKILKKLSKKFIFKKCDMSNLSPVKKIFKKYKFDQVVNLAAQAGVRYSIGNPKAYLDSNLVGFFNILDCSKQFKIKHLIYASTSSVYGNNSKLPFAEKNHADHPIQFYAATKRANELMAHSYSSLYNLPTTGLRFFTVYGPWGRPDMALFIFTKNILEEKPIDVFNYGKHTRDFTYIDDIVKGIIKIIDNPATSNKNWNSDQPDPATSNVPWRIYNIGNNKPILLMDYIKALEKTLDKKAIINYLPLQLGDVPDTCADTNNLKINFSYKPSTPVFHGVSNFVTWYKNYYQE